MLTGTPSSRQGPRWNPRGQSQQEQRLRDRGQGQHPSFSVEQLFTRVNMTQDITNDSRLQTKVRTMVLTNHQGQGQHHCPVYTVHELHTTHCKLLAQSSSLINFRTNAWEHVVMLSYKFNIMTRETGQLVTPCSVPHASGHTAEHINPLPAYNLHLMPPSTPTPVGQSIPIQRSNYCNWVRFMTTNRFSDSVVC